MAGQHETDLTELPDPILSTDHMLVGRSGQVYTKEVSKIIRPDFPDGFNIPRIADFPTWVAQDSASVTDIQDGFRLTNTARGNSDNMTCRVRSLPAGTSWTVTLAVRLHTPWYQYHSGGLVLRESATGKLETLTSTWPLHAGPVFSNTFSSPTSFNSTRAEYPFSAANERMLWLRANRNGTALQWSYGLSGVAFHLFGASFLVNNFFTTAPDQYGLCWNGRNNTLAGVVSAVDAIAWLE
jgi:hypothetical protein